MCADALATLFAAFWLANGGQAGAPVERETRWNFEPPRSILCVLGAGGAAALSGPSAPADPLGRLSPAGRQYLARLADLGRRRASAEPDTKLAGDLQQFLADQIRGVGPVAFVAQYPSCRPDAAACAIWQSVPERWGCRICVLGPADEDARPRTVFQDPEGVVFDMNLSLDAAILFFSFRRRTDACWQIYEIGVDGRGWKKLSRDRAHSDVSPVELPDGELLFVSTRGGGCLVSERGPRSNLYRMNRDGSGVRSVSQNTLADFSPQLLPDGRVLFTRWEYVDRDLDYRLGLWTQRPDGRQFQLYFGNTIREVGVFWQARGVPGHADLLVATFAPGHGWPYGAVGLVTNRSGPEAGRDRGFAWLTDESLGVGDRTVHADGMSFGDIDDGRRLDMALRDRSLQPDREPADLSLAHDLEARAGRWLDAARPLYRDPFPLSDHVFLVSYAASAAGRFDLYLLDLCGNRIPLYADPQLGSVCPLPLRPRAVFATPPVQPPAATGDGLASAWGTALVADVYRGLSGIQRGEAKYLQIMEQVPKTHEFTRRAYDQSPVMGYGTYYAKRCWGRVPIEPDGSAHFELPALREVYLQVLDAEGRELQRQTSSLQVMPGEMRSCSGCHEPRSATPSMRSSLPLAARRPPTRPVPPPWSRDGLVEFTTVVQPVLDKHCVGCHSGPAPGGGWDLSGDRTRFFNMAYDHLLGRSRSYRQHNLTTGEMLSQEAARGLPLVHFYWLRRAPTGTNPPGWSGSRVSRLADYLEPAHVGHEVPWEDRQRIYTWIDANVPFYAGYAAARPLSPGGRDLYTDHATGRNSAWYTERFLEVYQRRCLGCHGEFPHPNDHDRLWDGHFAWLNLTHPEWSPALTTHLAKQAGGRGVPTRRWADEPALFSQTTDPDYVTMLEAIRQGHRQLAAGPCGETDSR